MYHQTSNDNLSYVNIEFVVTYNNIISFLLYNKDNVILSTDFVYEI